MAQSEIQDLKRWANAQDNCAWKRQKLNVDARCLTSEEGLRLSCKQNALRVAQEQKKRAVQEQRAARDAEWQWEWMGRDPNEPFVSALTMKPKPDLQDIAQALGLSLEGAKKGILTRISNHFEANPSLHTPLDMKAFSIGCAIDLRLQHHVMTRITLAQALNCPTSPTTFQQCHIN